MGLKLIKVVLASLLSIGSLAQACPTALENREATVNAILKLIGANPASAKVDLFKQYGDGDIYAGAYATSVEVDGRSFFTTYKPILSDPDQNGCQSVVGAERIGPIGH
jgi:hypothetical protein